MNKRIAWAEYQEYLDIQKDIHNLPWVPKAVEINKDSIDLTNTAFITDDEFAVEVYENYVSAMTKHSSYVLDQERFMGLITEQEVNTEDDEYWQESTKTWNASHGCFIVGDSLVHGFFRSGLFVVSHFAPATMREGVKLVAKLKTYDNVVFAVTEYLSKMLDKLGYNFVTEMPQEFAGEIVTKKVYTSFVPTEEHYAAMMQL